MISEGETECLKGLYQPTNLKEQYNQKSPNPYPALMICGDKLIQQNKDIELHYLDYYDGKGSCTLPFNVRNLTSAGYALQEGYARNIDVDSELKRINHVRDKCYNDNYKMNHQEGVFNQHKKIYEQQTNLMNNIKSKSTNALNKKFTIQDNCITKKDRTTFDKCENPPIPSNNDNYMNNQSVYYSFNNQEYCKAFPCQKLFHNITRRSTLPADNSHHDVNPEFLSCCNQDF